MTRITRAKASTGKRGVPLHGPDANRLSERAEIARAGARKLKRSRLSAGHDRRVAFRRDRDHSHALPAGEVSTNLAATASVRQLAECAAATHGPDTTRIILVPRWRECSLRSRKRAINLRQRINNSRQRANLMLVVSGTTDKSTPGRLQTRARASPTLHGSSCKCRMRISECGMANSGTGD